METSAQAFALFGTDQGDGTAVSVPIIAKPVEEKEAEEGAAFQTLVADLEVKIGFKLDWAWLPKKA